VKQQLFTHLCVDNCVDTVSHNFIFPVHSNLDIGASANLELVAKFCYLGDMLSVDGDADAAVEARI